MMVNYRIMGAWDYEKGVFFYAIFFSDCGFGGTLSSSQDFKFALANLQKNFEKLAAKTDTNKMDDFLKLEVSGKLIVIVYGPYILRIDETIL